MDHSGESSVLGADVLPGVPPHRDVADVVKFPGPRKAGRCMVPPRGLTFDEYRPDKHGPLVECRYATASYSAEPGVCAICGKLGCDHPEWRGKVLTLAEWEALPDKIVVDHGEGPGRVAGILDKRGIWHER